MLDRLEKLFRPITIPNLTMILVFGQAIFFMAALANQNIVSQMSLQFDAIKAGEVWRLVTFFFAPPGYRPLLIIFQLLILWLIGRALENYWGHTRFNIYLWVGYLLTLGSAMLYPSMPVHNFFLMNSIFLAFAFLYPDFEFHLLFILPVKVKWLAVIDWCLLGYMFLMPGMGWGSRVVILASVANFFIFFGKDVIQLIARRKRATLKNVANVQRHDAFMHQCSVCGKTDRSDPSAEFRYLSEAGEAVCYCTDHLPGGHVEDEI